ncbi:hypothetical protein [Colwellia sp. E150_009]
MFELEKQSLFFESMANEHAELVQNIEIVFENQNALDSSYHNPKLFILNLNNALRSLLFFVETLQKNAPGWQKKIIKDYISENSDSYIILKKLRDMSAHQALIFPKESILTGLYRIRSSHDYVVKIGMGDLASPGNYSWDLAMKNTRDVFHDLLVFHSIAFMDLEHAALNECLGISRRWLFKVKFQTRDKSKSFNEVIDVYSLIFDFSMNLLDAISESYANFHGISCDIKFYRELKEFNSVNTLLELDLYPSLFSKWWECEISPMNIGVRTNKHKGEVVESYDSVHFDSYEKLCNTPESYKEKLIKFRNLPIEQLLAAENEDEFYSFIYLNHWHFKKAFKAGLMDSPLSPSDIMQMQRTAKILLGEIQKEKLCTIAQMSERFNKHLDALIEKI